MDKREERKLRKWKRRHEKNHKNSGHSDASRYQRGLYELGRLAVLIIVGVILGMVVLLNLLK